MVCSLFGLALVSIALARPNIIDPSIGSSLHKGGNRFSGHFVGTHPNIGGMNLTKDVELSTDAMLSSRLIRCSRFWMYNAVKAM